MMSLSQQCKNQSRLCSPFKRIWDLPNMKKANGEYKSQRELRRELLNSIFLNAFYNQEGLAYEAVQVKTAINSRVQESSRYSTTEHKQADVGRLYRYDPLGGVSTPGRTKFLRHALLGVTTSILCPLTLGTFCLNLFSETTRYLYASNPNPVLFFMHYCVFAPIRTIWSLVAEPFAKMTFWARDGFIYHAREGHKGKAFAYGAALLSTAILSWAVCALAVVAAVGVAVVKGLGLGISATTGHAALGSAGFAGVAFGHTVEREKFYVHNKKLNRTVSDVLGIRMSYQKQEPQRPENVPFNKVPDW